MLTCAPTWLNVVKNLNGGMMEKKYMNEVEMSEYTTFSVSKLRQDRKRKKGFPYTKIDGRVVYDRSIVDAIISENMIIPKSR